VAAAKADVGEPNGRRFGVSFSSLYVRVLGSGCRQGGHSPTPNRWNRDESFQSQLVVRYGGPTDWLRAAGPRFFFLLYIRGSGSGLFGCPHCRSRTVSFPRIYMRIVERLPPGQLFFNSAIKVVVHIHICMWGLESGC